MTFKWELISKNKYSIDHNRFTYRTRTFRAKVFGGWLISEYMLYELDEREEKWDIEIKSNIIFLADPKHEWNLIGES